MPISTIGSNSLNQTSDLTINGQTVGKGGGNVATNTVHGAGAMAANTTAVQTTAIGYAALASNTTGDSNNAFGRFALNGNTTGTDNVSLGRNSMLSNSTGSFNVAIGNTALNSNTTASNNTAVGYQALYTNATGTTLTALGYQAGKLTTVNDGTFIGALSGQAVTTGAGNTFLGYGSGYYITTGSKNTIIGGYTGNQGGIDIRTSSNNIVLSDGDGNVKQWWSNNGYWEYNSGTQLRLPSTGGTGYIGYLADQNSIQVAYNSVSNGVRLTSGATSWSTWSDQRLKNVTGTYTTPLADISQLQPIKFTWKSDTENKPQVGILAQSLQSVIPEAVDEGTISLEDETKYLTVRYTELIPLMVASIKELKTIVDAQAAEIAELKAKVNI